MRKNVSVTNSKTLIAAAGQTVNGYSTAITNLLVKNISTTVVYLQWTKEDDELTTSNGFPLGQNEAVIISRDNDSGGAPVYGITSSGTAEVRVSGD